MAVIVGSVGAVLLPEESRQRRSQLRRNRGEESSGACGAVAS
jgi:hypothetical protein